MGGLLLTFGTARNTLSDFTRSLSFYRQCSDHKFNNLGKLKPKGWELGASYASTSLQSQLPKRACRSLE